MWTLAREHITNFSGGRVQWLSLFVSIPLLITSQNTSSSCNFIQMGTQDDARYIRNCHGNLNIHNAQVKNRS